MESPRPLECSSVEDFLSPAYSQPFESTNTTNASFGEVLMTKLGKTRWYVSRSVHLSMDTPCNLPLELNNVRTRTPCL